MNRFLGSRTELLLVGAMVGILLVLFTPIPAVLLDVLLVANFSFALLILLLTFYVDKPIGFSTFPAILLIATLFRLSLNIAATRLILSDGDAGHVIGAVGSYVVGGNYVIGLVVFLILIVVQYVVVTSGAQRVAEVAARFTLDSMPGKQMSIDADLNMGLIDSEQAMERRSAVEKEASFYGSMDGASKFVKGDAIAGILIILIDIVGGLAVGMVQKGMAWGEALHAYTLLTVGDGIVTQIPALVISVAAGIIVTRASSDAFFGEQIRRQIMQYPKSLVIVALALGGLLILPGIPALPVLVIAALVIGAAWTALRQHQQAEADQAAVSEGSDDTLVDESDLYSMIQVEPIEVFVGTDLVPLIGDQEGLFMQKVKVFRKQLALELGFVLPNVRLKEDARLGGCAYELRIFGSRVGSAEVVPGQRLVIGDEAALTDLPGALGRDPAYGLPAKWVRPEQAEEARKQRLTVVDPMTVIATHFSEVMRAHAQELLTRDETEKLFKQLRERRPGLYEELIPALLSVGDVQAILQGLVRERVSIRNLANIVEVLTEKARTARQTDELVEAVRVKQGRPICDGLRDENGVLRVLTLEPSVERLMMAGIRQTETGSHLVLDPAFSEKVLLQVSAGCERMMGENLKPVLLVSPTLRRHLRRLTERLLAHLSVLALNEVPATLEIQSYSVVRVDPKTMSAAAAHARHGGDSRRLVEEQV